MSNLYSLLADARLEDGGEARPERPGDLTNTVARPDATTAPATTPTAQAAEPAGAIPPQSAVAQPEIPGQVPGHRSHIVLHDAPAAEERVATAPAATAETPAEADEVVSPAAPEAPMVSTGQPMAPTSIGTEPVAVDQAAGAGEPVGENPASPNTNEAASTYQQPGDMTVPEEAAKLEEELYGKERTHDQNAAPIPTSRESGPTPEEGIVA